MQVQVLPSGPSPNGRYGFALDRANVPYHPGSLYPLCAYIDGWPIEGTVNYGPTERGVFVYYMCGLKLSIQWGAFCFCTSNRNVEPGGYVSMLSPDAEIAVIDDMGPITLDHDLVMGYCSPSFVLDFMGMLSYLDVRCGTSEFIANILPYIRFPKRE